MIYEANILGLKLFIKEVNEKIKYSDNTIVGLYNKDIGMTSTLNKEDKVYISYGDYDYPFINFKFKNSYIGMLPIDDIVKMEYINEANEDYINNYHKIYLENSFIKFNYYFDEEEELLNKKIYEEGE